MLNFKKISFSLVSLVMISTAAVAETPEEKGLAIAVEADKRNIGWVDSIVNMRMILKNKQGDTSEREIRIKNFEVVDDGDKSLSIFDKPRDVRGTAFLTFSHVDKPDDQWLYLPALKRVKRISSRNKSGPFMGSEFAFEDIGSQEIAKYTYKFIKEAPCGDGLNCLVSERYPTDKFSGYTKQVSWIDDQEYRIIKTDFYDRRKSLLKTLEMNEYKQYLDKFWRPHNMVMTNHQTGKSSILNYSEYQFKTGLKDSDFNKSKLKRLR